MKFQCLSTSLSKTATTSVDIYKAQHNQHSPLILQEPMRWASRFLHWNDEEPKANMNNDWTARSGLKHRPPHSTSCPPGTTIQPRGPSTFAHVLGWSHVEKPPLFGSSIGNGECWGVGEGAAVGQTLYVLQFYSSHLNPRQYFRNVGHWSLQGQKGLWMNSFKFITTAGKKTKRLKAHSLLREAHCPGLYIAGHHFLLTTSNRKTKTLMSTALSQKANPRPW